MKKHFFHTVFITSLIENVFAIVSSDNSIAV